MILTNNLGLHRTHHHYTRPDHMGLLAKGQDLNPCGRNMGHLYGMGDDGIGVIVGTLVGGSCRDPKWAH